ncbi:MAG: type II toxin-antitoxin system VapC family toxin [Acidobacteria bacterium]|nr:type II toxin-antitoxin system VapC family toxin [Acidobacteriota bacterium]
MKSKVYLETTIVSYLVASSTHDLIQSAHQQVTREWWAGRERFDLFVSRPVLTEAGRGDTTAAARRLETLAGIPVLTVSRGATTLARTLLRTGTLPAKARLDAVHVAVAAVNGMDYLLTWNLRHLANAAIRGKIEEACRKAGIRPPIICTPEELMEA